MYISGELARRVALAITLVATLSLGACGGDDPADPSSKSTAVNKAAKDKKALENLATNLWAARTESQNSGNSSRTPYESLMAPGLIEVEVALLERYKKLKVTRTGAPTLTGIQTRVDGDSGEVLLCLNEDDWLFEEAGEPADIPKNGTVPWGAKAERTQDGWIITEILKSADAKTKKVSAC